MPKYIDTYFESRGTLRVLNISQKFCYTMTLDMLCPLKSDQGMSFDLIPVEQCNKEPEHNGYLF